MKRWVWTGDSFTWHFIAACVYLTAAWLGFDLAWRLIDVDILSLVVGYGLVVGVLGVVLARLVR